MATATKVRFPKKELNAWVKGRDNWTHDEWLALLSELSAAGFACYTETPEGQTMIGEHLESRRG